MNISAKIPSHSFPIIRGYDIFELLYLGSRTAVYRGIYTVTQQPVVIKVLRKEYPSFSELVQFRNQYAIAQKLPINGIVKPLRLEPLGYGYALIMEDFGGVSLATYAQQTTLGLTEILDIVVQVVEILHGMYQHRVIHKDIKPTNILIHPESKQVKLIDFSIASLLPREMQEIQNPNVLEGTLAYISPEQTGRMNRGIDYRSDFYSLGVTFYELLTGRLPFESDDPMELVHCHLAKQPVPIHQLNPEIPLVLSQIADKLMAKNAEDRYQSGLGLKHDLEICLGKLQETGNIEIFTLGARDISDHFSIPEKLYGREIEVSTLLNAFERVSMGNAELMLVAGFSGIGKTSTVNEIHKPIVRQRGYFIQGKYDQFQRNIPFSAFVQAFRDLMGQILSDPDGQMQTWKAKILSAVGDNGQILIDVIPELENIIGKQPIVAELLGSAAQNRFNQLFQKFVQIFTRKEHPLVIFLDDLQWADLASLKLMQLLMQEARHLLLLGAYRDNEVFPTHPFVLAVEYLQKTESVVNTITLQALSKTDMNQLVADTLNSDRTHAQPLSDLVYQKTRGNPFFASQFLKVLYEERQIIFDWDVQHWHYDIAQIRDLAFTDDVVEFMGLQLERLPMETQEALKLAACIGAQFDLHTLAIFSQKSPEDTAAALWEALQEGLIIPTTEAYKFFTQSASTDANNTNTESSVSSLNPVYKFLHDRVQQAAYSLILESQRKVTHLKIGQLLLQNSSESDIEEKLFDIVGHLNLGIELITQSSQKETLAQLNLKAGEKARNATAYVAARDYLQTAISLLEKNCWESQYELTLNCHVDAAEVAYLNADFDAMEQMATLVLQNAQTVLEKIKIYEIQITALTAQSNMLEAIAVGRNVLRQLGIEFPNEPNDALISKTLQHLTEQLQNRQIEELIDLSVMTDPKTQATMKLLVMLFSPIFQGMPDLLPILSSTMVSLSLRFGNAPASSVGYVIHGMVLCSFCGEVKAGYSFGRLALNLLEKYNLSNFKSIIPTIFGSFIQHQQESLLATLPTLKKGYEIGMEIGDFLHAGYSVVVYFYTIYFGGVELSSWENELEIYSALMAQSKQHSPQLYLDMHRVVLRNLREVVSQPDCLTGDIYDEPVMIPKHFQDNELTAIANAYIYKLQLAYLFGNYTNALAYLNQAQPYLMAVSGTVHIPTFHFYASLTYLALFHIEAETRRTEILEQVEIHQNVLHQWAQNTPMNHLHKWYLVEAERQRALGNKAEAIEFYDKTIFLSKANKFLGEEALANELTSKFYLTWNKAKVAAVYMQDAYYCFARWGAKAKVKDLEKRHPQLLAPILEQTINSLKINETFALTSNHSSQSTSKSTSSVLDMAGIIKASQAISSEIELDKLLNQIMQVLLESAGAIKSVLMLFRNEHLVIEATANLDQIQLIPQTSGFQSVPITASNDIPQSIISYVKNTLETLVINDASTQSAWANDLYIRQEKPKSILCLPILKQGQLIGILYLENRLTIGAFTSNRLEILNLLVSQAAISLENARLYAEQEHRVSERTQALSQKNDQLENTLKELRRTQTQMLQSEKMSALGQMVAGIAHEINNPVNFIHGNLTYVNQYIQDLMRLLNAYQTQYPHPSQSIQDDLEEVDLDFLTEDLTKILQSMKVGSDRIRDIVLSLRNFSRLDESEFKPIDLHQGIDNTLMILQHRLKGTAKRPEIEVVKQYGNLPLVECCAGQLNQVFMNLLANAIDALEEGNQGRSLQDLKNNPNRILIITAKAKSGFVRITIADNGVGIPEEVRSRLFDPFFTTKPVGKGTGLGLSISYQVVTEKHGGKLWCDSVLGKGTSFMIELPVSLFQN
ncbi:ATP-binding sensor histidine kinase [Pseudanabaena sp. BC1403]|uniref:trifunctional serine/threonine-protein kinase/ATP-binding protein/sensor histidine kinase n=1 Tax=Pseudanabaena sp. BC1403 TaxID=2043171 RepID=UPI000CD7FA39|nr:ATP-binding sensor histidine kinase [Pseudanabaena sp. BC1403]